MRARLMVSLSVVLALVAVPIGADGPATYGAGLTMSDVTPLTQVIERPASFEGRTVRVEGVVTAVCAHMGCWMALAPANPAEGKKTMLIKVDDGVIVFPVSAKGHRASAQGVVQRVGGDPEGREAAAEFEKQTGGSKADTPAQYQLKATGAVVY